MLHCVTRGKKSDVAVGDSINATPTAKGQAVIESINERRSLLYRSDQYKSKLLAANIDQLFIVVATEPGFSDDLVSRALVAAEAAEIEVHLILNKIDMTDRLEKARERIGFYASLGYPVHEVSATALPDQTLANLMPAVRDRTSVLIGQSGMGKSSLINLLVPGADIATQEISTVLNSGKHTTTYTRMYRIDEDTAVVDSPGFQEFGLYHLTEGMLERAFREFRPYLGHCRFYNCHHLTEPGCAILDAVEKGHIAKMRHQLYRQLVHESEQKIY
ncbi:ribosome small subunit-dependent GTPase A [Oxalobacter aliiformigenes]|uniref:ribosome small subunit-dependent GTPase A n=1 Tax=Oxalobacter aliiformigenes TaxID=2946593 RepID=UPI0039FD7051